MKYTNIMQIKELKKCNNFKRKERATQTLLNEGVAKIIGIAIATVVISSILGELE